MEELGRSEYRVSNLASLEGHRPESRENFFAALFPFFFSFFSSSPSRIGLHFLPRRLRGSKEKNQEKTGNRVPRFSARGRRIYSRLVEELLIDARESLFARKEWKGKERERRVSRMRGKQNTFRSRCHSEKERLPQLRRHSRMANSRLCNLVASKSNSFYHLSPLRFFPLVCATGLFADVGIFIRPTPYDARVAFAACIIYATNARRRA